MLPVAVLTGGLRLEIAHAVLVDIRVAPGKEVRILDGEPELFVHILLVRDRFPGLPRRAARRECRQNRERRPQNPEFPHIVVPFLMSVYVQAEQPLGIDIQAPPSVAPRSPTDEMRRERLVERHLRALIIRKLLFGDIPVDPSGSAGRGESSSVALDVV